MVVELIHETLREVENAHPHIDGSVHDQPALANLHSGQIIVKDVNSGKGAAGD